MGGRWVGEDTYLPASDGGDARIDETKGEMERLTAVEDHEP